jgi:hypothetical protein
MTSSIVDNQGVHDEGRRGLPREHAVKPSTGSAHFSHNCIQILHSSTCTSP